MKYCVLVIFCSEKLIYMIFSIGAGYYFIIISIGAGCLKVLIKERSNSFFHPKIIKQNKTNYQKMVEANKKCVLKHFPLDTENSFVQYTIDIPEAEYLRMTGQEEMQ